MNASDLKIIQPQNATDVEAYYNIRYEVLRKPWNQPHQTTADEFEDISLHFLALDKDGTPVGTGRLQINSPQEGQLRSMAVLSHYQGKGIGAKILMEIERIAIERGLQMIVLDARENAVPFYLKNGYAVTGTSYLLFGVIPHFKMEKSLKAFGE